jgi:hypothetical protein
VSHTSERRFWLNNRMHEKNTRRQGSASRVPPMGTGRPSPGDALWQSPHYWAKKSGRRSRSYEQTQADFKQKVLGRLLNVEENPH